LIRKGNRYEVECNPQTLEEITPFVRRIRNKAIKQYYQNLSIH